MLSEEGRVITPALLTEWGRTTVTWWTHKIKALHRNDFIMAAKRMSCISHELIRCHELVTSIDRNPVSMPGEDVEVLTTLGYD